MYERERERGRERERENKYEKTVKWELRRNSVLHLK